MTTNEKILGVNMMVLLLFLGCSSNQQQNSIANEHFPYEQGKKELEVIASDLNVPWSIEKHDHTFCLTETPVTIVIIENERKAIVFINFI
ncbi:hypothetical protein [Bacillus litorisediminis]|uniref:hypothetical protein n=1 Tax=Bacillus litorisediminis TaxID=2922713 RepID=UPI001FAEE790|nr:hypothetical protein [Bacillus litorisediminis]